MNATQLIVRAKACLAIQLRAAFSIFMVTNLAGLIFIGALLGSVSEMA